MAARDKTPQGVQQDILTKSLTFAPRWLMLILGAMAATVVVCLAVFQIVKADPYVNRLLEAQVSQLERSTNSLERSATSLEKIAARLEAVEARQASTDARLTTLEHQSLAMRQRIKNATIIIKESNQ